MFALYQGVGSVLCVQGHVLTLYHKYHLEVTHSTVMLAAEADNIKVKQAADILDAHALTYRLHITLLMRKTIDLLHQRNNALDLVMCRLSCRLGITTEGEEFGLYWYQSSFSVVSCSFMCNLGHGQLMFQVI